MIKKKLFRLSFNDDKVLHGPGDFWDARYTLHIRFKPIIYKWKKDFKELTVDFSNGFSLLHTTSNYNGYDAYSITLLGLTLTFGNNNGP